MEEDEEDGVGDEENGEEGKREDWILKTGRSKVEF